jgi:acyl-CoA thioester hydrolase
MYTATTQVRVRYGETDKMGFVYYGIYPLYYEIGRTELMREFKLPYKEIEDMGIILPVKTLDIKYHKAAKYDDLLTIKTSIKEIPGVRITFYYEILNEKEELLNEGTTMLIFVNEKTQRPMKAPDILIKQLEQYFQRESI